jgi:hypothetical protein
LVVDRYLRAGYVPSADRVQIEDMLNFFPYDYREPPGDAPLGVSVEAAECPWNKEHRLLRIAVVARRSGTGKEPASGLSDPGSSSPGPIAKDVRVQVALNPGKVEKYRLIGYDDWPGASARTDQGQQIALDLPAGRSVTALYELVPARTMPSNRPARAQRKSSLPDLTAPKGASETLTVWLHYRRSKADPSRFAEFPFVDSGRSLEAASIDFRFAAAVASFGMILRGSEYSGNMTLAAVEQIAKAARGPDPDGIRASFLELVAKARELGAGK